MASEDPAADPVAGDLLTATALDPARSDVADIIAWTAHPARDRPVAALFAGIALLAAATLTGFAFASPVVGALALLLLLASLRQFFFATTYKVDAQGVTLRCLGIETRRPWRRLRRFRYDERGGFLSPRARASLFDSFSGLHLTWNANVVTVVELIKRRLAEQIGKDGRTTDSSTAVQKAKSSSEHHSRPSPPEVST